MIKKGLILVLFGVAVIGGIYLVSNNSIENEKQKAEEIGIVNNFETTEKKVLDTEIISYIESKNYTISDLYAKVKGYPIAILVENRPSYSAVNPKNIWFRDEGNNTLQYLNQDEKYTISSKKEYFANYNCIISKDSVISDENIEISFVNTDDKLLFCEDKPSYVETMDYSIEILYSDNKIVGVLFVSLDTP